MKNITVKQIFDRFVHRTDVFAIQLKSGAYVPIKRDIKISDIQEHLNGEKTIGLYCLDKNNTVKWACVDLDGTDLPKLLLDGKQIFKEFKEFPRILEFSGRRGYHVWIFFNKPVSALYAQQLIKSRLNRIKINGVEVFPKQTELNERRLYGNLVKLIFGIHKKTNKRSKIILMEGF